MFGVFTRGAANNNNSSYYSYCFDQRFSCFFWRPRTRHFCTCTTYHRKIPTAIQLHENSQQAVMSYNRRYIAENSWVRDAIPSVLNVQLDGCTFLSGAPRNSVVLFAESWRICTWHWNLIRCVCHFLGEKKLPDTLLLVGWLSGKLEAELHFQEVILKIL